MLQWACMSAVPSASLCPQSKACLPAGGRRGRAPLGTGVTLRMGSRRSESCRQTWCASLRRKRPPCSRQGQPPRWQQRQQQVRSPGAVISHGRCAHSSRPDHRQQAANPQALATTLFLLMHRGAGTGKTGHLELCPSCGTSLGPCEGRTPAQPVALLLAALLVA